MSCRSTELQIDPDKYFRSSEDPLPSANILSVPGDCPGLSKDAARMTVTPRRPALSSPFEFCLVCGLVLASEAGMQSGLLIQQPHLTTKTGRTAFCRGLKKGDGCTCRSSSSRFCQGYWADEKLPAIGKYTERAQSSLRVFPRVWPQRFKNAWSLSN